MLRQITMLALAAATVTGTAGADPRIATRPYRPGDIVTLHGKAGIESTIAFADDERIENVAIGNSAAWQVTPNKRANLLFVKPAVGRARTNMTVVTDQRTYLFDLVSLAGTPPVYMLRFAYPIAPRAPIPAAAVTIAEPVAAPVAAPPAPPTPPSPTALRFDWTSRGDRRLLPARLFDDGHATFLQWPKDAALPALLVPEANGVEGPVNYTVRDGYIVIDDVPARLVLRTGRQMAILTPGARPEAAPPGGTGDAFPRTASAQR